MDQSEQPTLWPPVSERTNPHIIEFIAKEGADANETSWTRWQAANPVSTSTDSAFNLQFQNEYFKLLDTLLKPFFELTATDRRSANWDSLLLDAFPCWDDAIQDELNKVISEARLKSKPGLILFLIRRWVLIFCLDHNPDSEGCNSAFVDAMWQSIVGLPMKLALSNLPIKRVNSNGLEATDIDVVRNACNARMHQLTQLRDQGLEAAKNATPDIGTGDEATSVNHNNWIGILKRDLNKCAVVISRAFQIVSQTLNVIQDKQWVGAGEAPTQLLRALESDKTRKGHQLTCEIKSLMYRERYRRMKEPTKVTVWKSVSFTRKPVVYWIRIDRYFDPSFEMFDESGDLNPFIFCDRAICDKGMPIEARNKMHDSDSWEELEIDICQQDGRDVVKVTGNTISSHMCGHIEQDRKGGGVVLTPNNLELCFRVINLKDGSTVQRPCCCLLHTWCGQPFFYDLCVKCNIVDKQDNAEEFQPQSISEVQERYRRCKDDIQMMPNADELNHAFSFKYTPTAAPQRTPAYEQCEQKTVEDLVYHQTSEAVNLELSHLVEGDDKVRKDAITTLSKETLDDALVMNPDDTILVFIDGILIATLDILHRLGQEIPVFLAWGDQRLNLKFISTQTTIRKFDTPFRYDELKMEMRVNNLIRCITQTRAVFPGTHIDERGVTMKAEDATELKSVYYTLPDDKRDYCSVSGLSYAICIPFINYMERNSSLFQNTNSDLRTNGDAKRRKSEKDPRVCAGEFYGMVADWMYAIFKEHDFSWESIEALELTIDESDDQSEKEILPAGFYFAEILNHDPHRYVSLRAVLEASISTPEQYSASIDALRRALQDFSALKLEAIGVDFPKTFTLPHEYGLEIETTGCFKSLIRKAATIPTFALDSIFMPQLEKLGNRQQNDGIYTDDKTKFTDSQIAADMEQFYFTILMLTGRYLYEQGRHDAWQVFLYLLGANQSGKTTFQECLGHFFHASEKGYFSEKTESTFGPVHMVNKKICLITEGFGGEKSNGMTNLLKSLLSQDGGSFPVKNGAPYEVERTTVGIQGCGNTDLLCDDSGGGWSRRMACAEMPATAKSPRSTLADELKQLELGRIIFKSVLLYIAGIKATGFHNGASRRQQGTAGAKFWGPCNKSPFVNQEAYAAWDLFAAGDRPDGLAPKAFDAMKARVTSRNHPLTNALSSMHMNPNNYWFADSLPDWRAANAIDASGQQFCKAPITANGLPDFSKLSQAATPTCIFLPEEMDDIIEDDDNSALNNVEFCNFLYMPFDDKKDVGFMQMVQTACGRMDLPIKMALKRNEAHWWTQPLSKFGLFKVTATLPWPIGQSEIVRHCEWILNCTTKACFKNEKTSVQLYPSKAHKLGTA